MRSNWRSTLFGSDGDIPRSRGFIILCAVVRHATPELDVVTVTYSREAPEIGILMMKSGGPVTFPTASASIAIAAVSAIHFLISVAEMFLWNRLYGRLRQFSFTAVEAGKVRPIVANAGLYNGFLACGLLWSALSFADHPQLGWFFLACVAVAGVFGAITLRTPKTLAMQTIPAVIAAILAILAQP